MMQRIEADPAFWLGLTAVVGLAFTAVGALLGLLIAWAKARTAEYEARAAKGTADSAIAGQGIQQTTLVQHGEAIAALQATSQGAGGRGQGAGAPVVPAAPVTVAPPVPAGVTTPVAPAPSLVTFEQGAGAPSAPENAAPGGGLIVPEGG